MNFPFIISVLVNGSVICLTAQECARSSQRISWYLRRFPPVHLSLTNTYECWPWPRLWRYKNEKKKKNYPCRSLTDIAGGSDSCIQWPKLAFHQAAVRSLITPSILWGSCGDLPPRGCVVRINDTNLSQVLGDNAWDMVGPREVIGV